MRFWWLFAVYKVWFRAILEPNFVVKTIICAKLLLERTRFQRISIERTHFWTIPDLEPVFAEFFFPLISERKYKIWLFPFEFRLNLVQFL